MSILVYTENWDGKFKKLSFELVSYAKALVVDNDQLKKAQNKKEVIRANRILNDAFLTDVRPLLYMVRREKGLALSPIVAYIESGYQERIERERKNLP